MPLTPQEQRDHHTVMLLRHLFDKMCAAEEIASAKRGFLQPLYFYGWIDRQMSLLTAEDECAAAGVPSEVWCFVREVLEGGAAVERFAAFWYLICLGGRPPLVHDLQRIQLNCLLHWKDGRIMPIQIYIDDLMLEPGGKFSDGLVASLLAQRGLTIAHSVVESGLDGLHDKCPEVYRGMTPEDPYDVMMGLILRGIAEIRPELREPVKNWMRLAQAVLRAIIPAEARARLEANKRAWAQQRAEPPPGQAPGPVRGGFDMPPA